MNAVSACARQSRRWADCADLPWRSVRWCSLQCNRMRIGASSMSLRAEYHAVRDTVPRGTPCRWANHAVRGPMPYGTAGRSMAAWTCSVRTTTTDARHSCTIRNRIACNFVHAHCVRFVRAPVFVSCRVVSCRVVGAVLSLPTNTALQAYSTRHTMSATCCCEHAPCGMHRRAYSIHAQARVASEFEKTLEASEAFVRGVKEQRQRLSVHDVPLPRSAVARNMTLAVQQTRCFMPHQKSGLTCTRTPCSRCGGGQT